MKRKTILEIIAFAFFFLFVYTSLSKWYTFDFYIEDLHRSPLLGPFAGPISILIPGSELIVAALLLPDKTRKFGLIGSLVLMTLFTVYVAYVLLLTTERPCTCGGIIRKLTWHQHMVFNIVFLLLAITGILLHSMQQRSFLRNK
jgi:putative oxidoreductase